MGVVRAHGHDDLNRDVKPLDPLCRVIGPSLEAEPVLPWPQRSVLGVKVGAAAIAVGLMLAQLFPWTRGAGVFQVHHHAGSRSAERCIKYMGGDAAHAASGPASHLRSLSCMICCCCA